MIRERVSDIVGEGENRLGIIGGDTMNSHNDMHGEGQSAERNEPPPFMRTWNRVYVSIIIYTGILILALYLVTIKFNR